MEYRVVEASGPMADSSPATPSPAYYWQSIHTSMVGKGRYLDNLFIDRLWWTVKYEEVYVRAYESVLVARERLR